MEKPMLSPDFTIDDIHKIREYNYETTKDISYNDRCRLTEEKLDKIANEFPHIKAVLEKNSFVCNS